MNRYGPTLCPYCDGITHCEYVDIGVGFQQVTARQCQDCLAVEMGHPEEDRTKATDEERKVGWWRGPPEPNPYEREPEDVERIRAGLMGPFTIENPRAVFYPDRIREAQERERRRRNDG